MKIRYGFFRDLAARKQDIFFIISFCNISKKVGYFNTRFVLYSIKIKTNIKQKIDRKIRVKVADFFFWTRSDSAHPFWSGPKLSGTANNGEALHCSREQWRVNPLFKQNNGERMDAGEWEQKGGGGQKGRGKADQMATLTATLVVFLRNEVVVHWGAASLADGSSYSALCAFSLVLLPFFSFLFSLSLLLLQLLSVFFHFSFVIFFPFLSSLFVYVSLYSLLSVSSLFSFYFSPLKLPKSVVSIPSSSLSFTSSVISSFFSRVLLSIMSLCFFFSPLVLKQSPLV